ncbi:MAG: hypothetical protein IKF90_22135 [Parasporobacterium sp.]|nr:hypothetical protein [Parasporobacterium sp.]
MSLRATIKNDLWRFSYVLPFARKYKNNEKGKANLVGHLLHTYRTIKPVEAKGTKSIGADTKALLSQIEIQLNEKSFFVYFLDTFKTVAVPGNVLSNFTLAYDKIIHGSFDDLEKTAVGNDEYGKEAQLISEGIHTLAIRIFESLKAGNHPNKEKLNTYFIRMLSAPAEHFDEALQRILFFNQILWQTRHRLNGLGRLDLILNDLYEKDVSTGFLTESNARNLVCDFLTQLSQYPEYKSDALQGDIGQIIILGGTNKDNTYFNNSLTTIFLQEQANLKKPDPKVLLRVSSKMPAELLKTAVECLMSKTGSPLFSNDDVVIPALIDSGVDEEDAYDYCVSACWEPLIVGKSIAQNNIGSLNFLTALDNVLEESVMSFDELLEKYIEKNQEVFRETLKGLDAIKWAKDPLISMFTDGSAEIRKDISDGGCKYPNYGVTTVALSNVVDSLLVIQSLVFQEKKYTLRQLNEARKKNFKDADDLFAYLQETERSFGHDREDIVSLVNKITESIGSIAQNYTNPIGGTVKFGLSSPDYNMLGRKSIGDFSGRKTGMPYNTHISCRDAAYTEVVNFASGLEYNKQRYNGNVVDFFVSPNLIENNPDKFVLFMKGAIESGFFQMQMNVLDSKTLIEAKAHPEKYQGLIVRVWGFSAYFNELPDSYKDLMIERAQAAERIA